MEGLRGIPGKETGGMGDSNTPRAKGIEFSSKEHGQEVQKTIEKMKRDMKPPCPSGRLMRSRPQTDAGSFPPQLWLVLPASPLCLSASVPASHALPSHTLPGLSKSCSSEITTSV